MERNGGEKIRKEKCENLKAKLIRKTGGKEKELWMRKVEEREKWLRKVEREKWRGKWVRKKVDEKESG